MLGTIGSFILNFVWGKLIKEGIPWVVNWIKNLVKGKQIDSEVDKEEDEIALIRKEIDKWLEKNPNAKKIPKELENKMRVATDKRNRGLSNGI